MTTIPPVIDLHAHAGRWGSVGVDDDPDRYVEIMDEAGIDRTCINCIFYGDATMGNDTVARFIDRYPDRFVGVAFVTPHYPEEAIPELERAYDSLGFKMLKVYPPYALIPLTDPKWAPIFEWCDARSAVVMSHSDLGMPGDHLHRPRLFAEVARMYTNVSWVLGHAGNLEAGRVEAVEAAKHAPNIYLETATSWGGNGAIEFLVEGAGQDRVLFGSDMPLMDARYQIGRVATSAISDEAKHAVLGGNAARLLGL